MPLLARIMSRAKLAERFDADTAAALSGVGAMTARLAAGGTARSGGGGTSRGATARSGGIAMGGGVARSAAGGTPPAGPGSGRGVGDSDSGRAPPLPAPAVPLALIPATGLVLASARGPAPMLGFSFGSHRFTAAESDAAAGSPSRPVPVVPFGAMPPGLASPMAAAVLNVAGGGESGRRGPLALPAISQRRLVDALAGPLSARIVDDDGSGPALPSGDGGTVPASVVAPLAHAADVATLAPAQTAQLQARCDALTAENSHCRTAMAALEEEVESLRATVRDQRARIAALAPAPPAVAAPLVPMVMTAAPAPAPTESKAVPQALTTVAAAVNVVAAGTGSGKGGSADAGGQQSLREMSSAPGGAAAGGWRVSGWGVVAVLAAVAVVQLVTMACAIAAAVRAGGALF
jgi:hypothetical protein